MGVIAPPDARPDFLALLYPAIPLGIEATSSTPRAFIAQADDDRLAPQDNSVRFYLALKQAKVPAELLVFSNGGPAKRPLHDRKHLPHGWREQQLGR